MIKIFRKIRQQLLSQNRFSKYLLYAIGEIILVVIGILIALSINNWNNDRQDREKEAHFLSEIKSNLEQDLNSIERVLAFNKTKDSAIDVALSLMSTENRSKRTNTSFLGLLPILTEFQVFLSNSVAFDNMTSSESIGLISNDTLRQQLSNYYKRTASLDNFTQEQIKNQTRRFVDESIPMLINEDLVRIVSGYSINFDKKEDFYTSPKSFKNLYNMKMNIKAQNDLMKSLSNQINGILEYRLNQK